MTLKKMTPNGEVTMTTEEEMAIRAEWAANDELATARANAEIVAQAKAILANRTTRDRIADAVNAGTKTWQDSDVTPWLTYWSALRSIIEAGSGTLPDRPVYPSGT